MITTHRILKVLILCCTGEKLFKFYWFDAYEDSYAQPGNAFSFFFLERYSLKGAPLCKLGNILSV